MEPFFLIANINGSWDVILLLLGMFMFYVGGPVLLFAGGVQFILLVVGWATEAIPLSPAILRGSSRVEPLPWDEILAEPEPAAKVQSQRDAMVSTSVQVRVAPLASRGVVWFPHDGVPWLRPTGRSRGVEDARPEAPAGASPARRRRDRFDAGN